MPTTVVNAGRQVAIVTGAASGIGRATANRLVGDGYRVHGLDFDADGLAATGATLPADQFAPASVDLRDLDRLDDVVTGILEKEETAPGLLVNVAGVGVAASAVETSVDEWELTMAVNLSAVFHTCRMMIPAMIRRGSGVIVNVASVGGLVGLRRRAAYCASKAGVVGLTRALAADHAVQGIRVNAICPGTVATEWIDKILADAPNPAELRRSMEERQLDGRMGSADEVASGICFLASPEARFVNGSAFVMDGGLTAV